MKVCLRRLQASLRWVGHSFFVGSLTRGQHSRNTHILTKPYFQDVSMSAYQVEHDIGILGAVLALEY